MAAVAAPRDARVPDCRGIHARNFVDSSVISEAFFPGTGQVARQGGRLTVRKTSYIQHACWAQTPAILEREKRRSASEEMLDLDRRLSLHSSIKQ